MDNKAVSYAMALACSLSMTAAGFFTVLPAFAESGGDVRALLPATRYNSFICTFFGTFCLLDIAYGVVFYPKQIDLLTGWVHHPIYIWLMYFVHKHGLQGGFCLFLVEELPTTLLALGNVYRPLRTNLAFGASFFATRIAWHTFMLGKFWTHRRDISQPLWALVTLTLALHLHWFYGYLRQQARVLRIKPAAKTA